MRLRTTTALLALLAAGSAFGQAAHITAPTDIRKAQAVRTKQMQAEATARAISHGVVLPTLQDASRQPLVSREITWSKPLQAWKSDSTRVGYRYNALGYRTRRASYSYSARDSSSLSYYYPDAIGRDTMVEFYLRATGGGAWRPDPFFTSINRYDDYGINIYSTLESTLFPISGYQYLITRDAAGRITESIQQGTDNNGDFQDESRIVYSYPADTGGYDTQTNYDPATGGAWTESTRLANVKWLNFNAGKDTAWETQTWSGTDWVTDATDGRYHQTWNGESYVLVKELLNDTTYVPSIRQAKYFTTNGSSLLVTENYNGTDYDSTARSINTFDNFGNQTLHSDETNDGTGWTFTSASYLVYDYVGATADINRIVRSTYNTDSARVFLDSRSEYELLGPVAAITPQAAVKQLVVYPNPATAAATLYLPENTAGEAMLLDGQGRAVATYRVDGKDVTLPTANLPAGLYNVRITGGKETYSARVVKQ